MTGILEQMNAAVQQNTQEIAALKAAVASLQAGAAGVAAMQQPQQQPMTLGAPTPAAGGFGGMTLGAPQQPQQPQTYPPATSDEIVALIGPYVENETIKAALQAEMNAMGITGLPQTQPHQYAELHHRFKTVIARFQQPQPQQQQQPMSLI